jgi:RpiR family transcriptional regulator, carbohydrate utilization regulator
MTFGVLQKAAEVLESAPAARRSVLALILADPQRVLGETFESLAQRAHCSVPTIMRTCRDLGYPGLREFKVALAQALAVGGSPLNRQVRLDDGVAEVIAKVTQGAAAAVNGVRTHLDAQAVKAAADAVAAASRVDCYGVGVTSNFMAADLQARLFRLGLMANAYPDIHVQLVSAATIGPQGVVIALTHVGGMPSLIEAIDVARSRGAIVIALTQPDTLLAAHADILLAIHVPEDPVMPVGPEAYLAHLTVIEILTVLVAQRLGGKAIERLQSIHQTLTQRGIDSRHHPTLDWGQQAPAEPL